LHQLTIPRQEQFSLFLFLSTFIFSLHILTCWLCEIKTGDWILTIVVIMFSLPLQSLLSLCYIFAVSLVVWLDKMYLECNFNNYYYNWAEYEYRTNICLVKQKYETINHTEKFIIAWTQKNTISANWILNIYVKIVIIHILVWFSNIF
jgi:hypothetical protein